MKKKERALLKKMFANAAKNALTANHDKLLAKMEKKLR